MRRNVTGGSIDHLTAVARMGSLVAARTLVVEGASRRCSRKASIKQLVDSQMFLFAANRQSRQPVK
jgi:hypothetical protein